MSMLHMQDFCKMQTQISGFRQPFYVKIHVCLTDFASICHHDMNFMSCIRRNNHARLLYCVRDQQIGQSFSSLYRLGSPGQVSRGAVSRKAWMVGHMRGPGMAGVCATLDANRGLLIDLPSRLLRTVANQGNPTV